jgi:hypothetical protein
MYKPKEEGPPDRLLSRSLSSGFRLHVTFVLYSPTSAAGRLMECDQDTSRREKLMIQARVEEKRSGVAHSRSFS